MSTTTAGTGYTGAVTWASSGGALGGTFAAATVYTATITLTPTSGYTLTGVSANFFTVAGATPVTNLANAGVITAVFPATTTTISAPAIAGVTAPVTGATPVSTTTAGTGYTGTVAWSGSPATFASATTYTATITLTAAAGYTLTGVTANFFTVAGAGSVTHSANSGVITGVFYMVGSTGPGGGKVFYVATTPFDCGPTHAAKCTYLEASPGVLNTDSEWSNDDNSGTAVLTSTGIGWGYSNTIKIIQQGNVVTSAAALADSYTVTVSGVVYDDWFLPSKDELNQLHLKQGTVGGFVNPSGSYIFWSSSEYEYDTGAAWEQYFYPGYEYDGGVVAQDKYYPSWYSGFSYTDVLPVRSF